MFPDANLLLYLNLSGEAFYIIAHRMKSQGVSTDLQQRVYNDLAISICHPTVVQSIVKEELQPLAMSLTDLRQLLDRIVHSSIMTINSYSMEKLFELTLIATRYQYCVCQHPKDILLIALNHLDAIRKSVRDPTGIRLCENLHKTLVNRLSGQCSLALQEYRFAILTYLTDVKLKMTNLIKLGYQKPTGEYVKDFPVRKSRWEFRESGTIEMPSEKSYESQTYKHGWKFSTSQSSEDSPENTGCDDEILEIEYIENSFEEVFEPKENEMEIKARFQHEPDGQANPNLCYSLELWGERGIVLGQSVYEIPGNSDEDDEKKEADSCATNSSLKGPTAPLLSAHIMASEMEEITVKAVHGLQLCSIMLGCKEEEGDQKFSASSTFHEGCDETMEVSEKKVGDYYSPGKSPMTGINVVKFDARRDRSQSKAALSKISQQLEQEDFAPEPEKGNEHLNVFDVFYET